MDIKVLGTQFNVTAYENEANMQVVLVSGKVEVNLDKCKNVLAPNQMFSYDSKIHKGKSQQSIPTIMWLGKTDITSSTNSRSKKS